MHITSISIHTILSGSSYNYLATGSEGPSRSFYQVPEAPSPREICHKEHQTNRKSRQRILKLLQLQMGVSEIWGTLLWGGLIIKILAFRVLY